MNYGMALNYGLHHRYYTGQSLQTPTPVGLGFLGQDAGAPTGSVLHYTATWQITLHQVDPSQNLVTSDTQILGIVSQNIPGLQIVNQSTTFSTPQSYIGLAQDFTVNLTLQVIGPGFSSPQDARSIVDHAYYIATQTMPVNSAIGVQSIPSAPGQATQLPGTPPPTPQGEQPQSVPWYQVLFPSTTGTVQTASMFSSPALLLGLVFGIVLLTRK